MSISNIFFNWTISKLKKLQENVCTPEIKRRVPSWPHKTKISTTLKILKLKKKQQKKTTTKLRKSFYMIS